MDFRTELFRAGIGIDNEKLLKHVVSHFGFEELKTIAFALNFDYESVPATDKVVFSRELIMAMRRRNSLDKLCEKLYQQRPQVGWWRVVNMPPRLKFKF